MSDTFKACTLPWGIGTGGLTLTHSDTDVSPQCSVEFGALVVRPDPPYQDLWVRVEFVGAAFASAKPHRDDEELVDVTGYVIDPSPKGNVFAVYAARAPGPAHIRVRGQSAVTSRMDTTLLGLVSHAGQRRRKGTVVERMVQMARS